MPVFRTGSLVFAVILFLASLVLTACSGTRQVVIPSDTDSGTVAGTQQIPQQKPQTREPAVTSQQKPSLSQPQSEYEQYRKQVIASWYGRDFHGKPTASGEIYNMHGMTCAHKELPFGTRLKVVNTANNLEVECIVNDRGPFVAGRDLDMSYGAAMGIEMIGTGTALVNIEATGRDMRYVKYVKYSGAIGTVTIQIGSFKDEGNAKRLKLGLELKYQNVYIMQANVNGNSWYRVRIGKFKAKDDAVVLGRQLAEEGYPVLITKHEQQL
ncbi:MAG: septal ring lytic transglycosylase RlpA family protein [Nitrospiraceae bacterium]|nr:septal ring lytic transglycosylase RlpA family protein [Nitrospiraceae bacterium]